MSNLAHIKTLHDQAMDLTDQALSLRRSGSAELALAKFRLAFPLERSVAEAVAALRPEASALDVGVFCRSAATLALDAQEPLEAIRLAELGLAANPDSEIVEELREVRFAALRMAGRPIE